MTIYLDVILFESVYIYIGISMDTKVYEPMN